MHEHGIFPCCFVVFWLSLRSTRSVNKERKLEPFPSLNHFFAARVLKTSCTITRYVHTIVFSRGVTVFLDNGTAAMLVSPTNPPGIELYYHANDSFVSMMKNKHYT